MGGSLKQRRTDPAMSPINAFSIEELYTPQISDSFQENTSYWQELNREESPVEAVATSPPKTKKPTRARQKRMIQSDDAPRQIAWTHEEEIALAKGWVAVSENSRYGNSRKEAGFCCAFWSTWRAKQNSTVDGNRHDNSGEEQREAFLEIKRRDVECRERDIAAQEYRQPHEDIRLYLRSYDHLIGEQQMAMDEARVEIKAKWPPRVTLERLLPHARDLGFKPRREGFPLGAKKEWGLSPKAKVRVLHTAQLWPPKVTLERLLSHARGLGVKPRREGFPLGAKKEWGLSPKAKIRVLHTAQLYVTVKSNH
nr:hypothetical protein [Tanacetum cinerariifolium]